MRFSGLAITFLFIVALMGCSSEGGGVKENSSKEPVEIVSASDVNEAGETVAAKLIGTWIFDAFIDSRGKENPPKQIKVSRLLLCSSKRTKMNCS
jgi:hypothetical protein